MGEPRAGRAPVVAPIWVVKIGPWRLRVHPGAGRWRGADAATGAVRLLGCMSAPGRSHLSLQIEYVAVMVHLMRGAGEHNECSGSSFDARVAGKPCGPLWRRPHTAPNVCPQVAGQSPRDRASCCRLERNNNPPLPCNSRGGAGDRTSFISKRTVASAPSEPLSSSRAVQAASLRLRAGSHALAGAAGRRMRR